MKKAVFESSAISSRFQTVVAPIFSKGSMPILVAWSGGADSTCLLHLLIQFFRERQFSLSQIHAVYVDHGWRAESKAELELLRKKSEELGISFHGEKIAASSQNCEEAARNGRYRLFADLCKKIDAEYVFVGHQRSDQAEGILKRVFEGASFIALAGMQARSILFSDSEKKIEIVRPLIDLPRSAVEHWLVERKISFLHDPTNDSLAFTRNRMRRRIIPEIEAHFGKKIESGIAHLCREASRLSACVGAISRRLFRVERLGGSRLLSLLELDEWLASEPFIIEQLLHFHKNDIEILSKMSLPQIEGIGRLFSGQAGPLSEKIFENKIGTVIVRKGLLLASPCVLQQGESVLLSHDSFQTVCFGAVSVDIELISISEQIEAKIPLPDWKDLFSSDGFEVKIGVDERPCRIGPVSDRAKSKDPKCKARGFQWRCPFYSLRQSIPALWGESGKMIYSPLVQMKPLAFSQAKYQLRLKFTLRQSK